MEKQENLTCKKCMFVQKREYGYTNNCSSRVYYCKKLKKRIRLKDVACEYYDESYGYVVTI